MTYQAEIIYRKDIKKSSFKTIRLAGPSMKISYHEQKHEDHKKRNQTSVWVLRIHLAQILSREA